MNPEYAADFVWAVLLLAFVVVLVVTVFQKRRGGHGGPGPGAYGAVYDLLNQDKRNAIELIVEEKAGARDPEDADGNLPDLEKPKRSS
jgi:hypothetical protein